MPPEAKVNPLKRIIMLYRDSAHLHTMFNIHLEVPRHPSKGNKREKKKKKADKGRTHWWSKPWRFRHRHECYCDSYMRDDW